MSEVVTSIVIWWIGALCALAALLAGTYFLVEFLFAQVARRCLRLFQLSRVYYWLNRMDVEGLTVCCDEYRRMVSERNPKSLAEFSAIDRECQRKGHG